MWGDIIGIKYFKISLLVLLTTLSVILSGCTVSEQDITSETKHTTIAKTLPPHYAIGVTASQLNNDTIVIKYLGGPDHDFLESIEYNVNGITSSITERPNAGATYNVSGVATTGLRDHVIVNATFADGTKQLILDTYV